MKRSASQLTKLTGSFSLEVSQPYRVVAGSSPPDTTLLQ